jgi:hydrogenase-1 operon protein HyaF
MSKIHEIPVVVFNDAANDSAPDVPTNSVVLAVLNELEAKLDALVADNEESTIDLRWMSGMPLNFELLRKTLGQGEVAATITNVGSTLVQETAVPCVWWISHRDSEGSRQGEFIEITDVPELLRSDRLSIQQGLAKLRVRCAQLDMPDPFSSMSSKPGS